MSGWYLYHQHSEAQASLSAAKQQWAELEKSVSNRRSEYQASSAVMTIKDQIKGRKAELKKLQDEVATLDFSQKKVVLERHQLIVGLRQKFIGRDVNLTLTSGRNLGQVKILKVEDSGISLATTNGVVKVSPGELSPEIREALFLNK
jgi:NADH dehydrogenase FAD-containing subunit